MNSSRYASTCCEPMPQWCVPRSPSLQQGRHSVYRREDDVGRVVALRDRCGAATTLAAGSRAAEIALIDLDVAGELVTVAARPLHRESQLLQQQPRCLVADPPARVAAPSRSRRPYCSPPSTPRETTSAAAAACPRRSSRRSARSACRKLRRRTGSAP